MRLFEAGGIRGRRKFTLAYTALILTTLANVCGSLSGESYAMTVGMIVGAFMGGNALIKKWSNGENSS
jgi:hypothetical protein